MAAVAAFGILAFASCTKDKAPSHRVQFKAEASAGSYISAVAYGIDGNTNSASSINSNIWISQEITAPAGSLSANVAVNAYGANASSTLKVQIYVDGKMVQEGTSSGQYLSASAGHQF
ncbi:hypothetical protein D9M68_628700 [compost metagenome]